MEHTGVGVTVGLDGISAFPDDAGLIYPIFPKPVFSEHI